MVTTQEKTPPLAWGVWRIYCFYYQHCWQGCSDWGSVRFGLPRGICFCRGWRMIGCLVCFFHAKEWCRCIGWWRSRGQNQCQGGPMPPSDCGASCLPLLPSCCWWCPGTKLGFLPQGLVHPFMLCSKQGVNWGRATSRLYLASSCPSPLGRQAAPVGLRFVPLLLCLNAPWWLQVAWVCIRSAKQDDNYGASNIILPCPSS